MTLPRIVWLLADGLPNELVRAYCAARPGSTLARLHAQRRIVPLTPLAPNCQTPPSLFTIWSAREAAEHGLLGYDVPHSIDGDPCAYVNGFQSWPRETGLVWDLYASRQRTIRTCAVPFVDAERLSPYLLSATDVFRKPLAQARVLADGDVLSVSSLALRVEASHTEIVLRDPDGHEHWRCGLAPDSHPATPLSLPRNTQGDSHLGMRLRGAWIDGSPRLVSLGYCPMFVHGAQAHVRKEQGSADPYVIANPGKLYAGAALGRRLDQGGQGHAERLLVSLMRDVHDSFSADIRHAVKDNDADLVVGYYPVIDLLSHQLLRYAVNREARFDGPLAEAFIDVVDWLDCLIGELAGLIDPQARFIINSDHGMLPIEWDVCPNVFFASRGWLVCRADGRIDPHRSAAFLHPAENGLLVFHRERLSALGLTPDALIEALAVAVAESGLRALGTITGVPAPLGSAWQTDRYLRVPDGARMRAVPVGELVKPSPKGGDHTVYGEQAWLRGTAIDAGTQRWLAPWVSELALAQLMPLVTTASPSWQHETGD